MVHDPNSANACERELEDVLAGYYESAERGGEPDRQTLLDRHPRLAAELNQFFAVHDEMHRLAAPLRPVNAPPIEAAEQSAPTERNNDAARAISLIPYLAPSEFDADFGDYELLGLIARGGMGIVFRARQRSLNRLVALKVLRDGPHASVDDRRRFRIEAEAVANLDHPHIVPIYDVGERRGCSFLSMKLIDGGNLSERLREFTHDARAGARLIAAVARAVQHAHERGILHRDLKPSNILIDERGDPVVTDFGLARRLEGDSELTRTGAMLGTPAYMAPEQASGLKGAVTIATDVHGLGAVLYTIMTGVPPFRADSVLESLARAREHAPKPPRAIRPSTDRDLETICLKCLEKDPKARYPSAAAVADDLDRWLAGQSIRARPTGRAERAWRLFRRHPRFAAVVGAVIVLLVTSLIGLVATSRARVTAARLDEQLRRGEELRRRQQYARDVKQASEFWAENRPEEALKLLDRYQPRSGSTDLREFTWHYLSRQCTSLGRTLAGHVGPVYSAAFSPDGKSLATAGQDRTVRIWDAATGQARTIVTDHSDDINWVSYSPDGRLLATASDDQTVKLWDASSGKLKSTLNGHGDRVVAAEFTPDGQRLISSARAGGIRVWDVVTYRLCDSFSIPNGTSQSIAISPDGTMLALAGECVIVWSIARQSEMTCLKGFPQQVNGVAFSHDGKHLAAGGRDRYVDVWSTRDWLLEARVLSHAGRIESVAFSPDDRTIASGGDHGKILLSDLHTGSKSSVDSVQHRIWRVAFSRDGRNLAAASDDGTVRLLEIAYDLSYLSIGVKGPSTPSFAFSVDGNCLTVVDRSAQLRKLGAVDGHLIETKRFDSSNPNLCAAVSQNANSLVACAEDGRGALWDVAGDRLVREFPPGKSLDTLIAIAPDGHQIARRGAGRDENRLEVWSSDGFLRNSFDGRCVESILFSPGGTLVSTWGGCDIKLPILLEISTGKAITPNSIGHRVTIDAEAFAADGATLATGDTDGSVILWSVPGLERRSQLPTQHMWIRSLAFSNDGRSLAVGYQDGLVRIWDPDLATELACLDGHSGPVVRACFSPDGRTLATCAETPSGYQIFLWRGSSK